MDHTIVGAMMEKAWPTKQKPTSFSQTVMIRHKQTFRLTQIFQKVAMDFIFLITVFNGIFY